MLSNYQQEDVLIYLFRPWCFAVFVIFKIENTRELSWYFGQVVNTKVQLIHASKIFLVDHLLVSRRKDHINFVRYAKIDNLVWE